VSLIPGIPCVHRHAPKIIMSLHPIRKYGHASYRFTRYPASCSRSCYGKRVYFQLPSRYCVPPLTPPLPTSEMTMQPPTLQECTTDEDCVPAECCHPTRCINRANKGVCNLLCTMSCEGPLDCGAGSCGCVNGKCNVVASGTSFTPTKYQLP
jgi:hypothetical protein